MKSATESNWLAMYSISSITLGLIVSFLLIETDFLSLDLVSPSAEHALSISRLGSTKPYDGEHSRPPLISLWTPGLAAGDLRPRIVTTIIQAVQNTSVALESDRFQTNVYLAC